MGNIIGFWIGNCIMKGESICIHFIFEYGIGEIIKRSSLYGEYV